MSTLASPRLQRRQVHRAAAVRLAVAFGACALVFDAGAADVRVVGVFTGKAVVSIDGAAPRTLSVGQKTSDGVTLIGVDGQQAQFDVNGARRTLTVGQGFSAGPPVASGARTVLTADSRGHFWADGAVNGGAMRFMVDTGATVVALPAADARRIGLNYFNAPRTAVSTANGMTVAHLVKLDTVKIGDITLTNVDAVVQENGLATPLLGMSFLNRTDMRRDGPTMTLVRRF